MAKKRRRKPHELLGEEGRERRSIVSFRIYSVAAEQKECCGLFTIKKKSRKLGVALHCAPHKKTNEDHSLRKSFIKRICDNLVTLTD